MRLSIRLRLALLAAVPLALYVLTSLYLLDHQSKNFDELKHEIYDTASRVNTLVLNADRDMYQAYTAYLKVESGALNDTEKAAEIEEVTTNLTQARDRLTEASEILAQTGIGEYTYGDSGRSVTEISEAFAKSFGSWSENVTAAVMDNINAARNVDIDQGFIESRSGIDELGQNIDKYAEINMTEMQEKLELDMTYIFAATIIISIITIIMVVITVRMIMKTVFNVVSKTKRVTEFDLTVEADKKYGKDEIGDINRSVDQMIDMIKKLIHGIAVHAKEVSTSSSQLTITSKESNEAANHVALNIQEVATGSEVQARGSAEASKAIEEMTVGIQRIAENTASLAEHSTSTSNEVNQGNLALERLVEQMQIVKLTIEDLSETIISLEKRSNQIGEIAENITKFSNQTNILSLNASIEAARAGEHGRGFAVVAAEIRDLAASSLASAEGIHELVDATRSEINGAASQMTQTKVSFAKGSDQITEIRQNLEIIVTAVNQMTEQLHENSAITEQMSASSEEVSASMEQTASTASVNMTKTEQVAAATEEQLALVENISSTAEQLSELVNVLNKEVSKFKL